MHLIMKGTEYTKCGINLKDLPDHLKTKDSDRYDCNDCKQHSMRLAELFVKESLSLELLLYLNNESETIENVRKDLKEIDPKLDVDNLLFKLRRLKMIKDYEDLKNYDNIVEISGFGKSIIEKLQDKYQIYG